METQDITQSNKLLLTPGQVVAKRLGFKKQQEGKGSTLVEEKAKRPGCRAKKRYKQAREDKI